jgi:SAM-dependent methyltransferase
MAVDRLLEATARAERDHFWFRGFRRFVSPMLARAAAGRRGLRLLDCGCGTGTNLRLQLARGSGLTRVAQASAAAVPYPAGAFDIVTSFDVLVCLPDAIEREAVREMWRVLKPGGAAVINVAAMEVLRGNHSVLSAELRRYSRASLRALLEPAGFRVERMTYTNAALFPLMLGVRGAQRVMGLAQESEAEGEITVPPSSVNAALSALLAVEAGLVRVLPMPFGSSLLCLARKPA